MVLRQLCALVLLASLAFAVDPALKNVFDKVGIDLEQYTIHDPSRVITKDGRQLVAATGKAQEDGYECGLETWHRANPKKMWEPGQCLFVEKPQWIKNRIPSQVRSMTLRSCWWLLTVLFDYDFRVVHFGLPNLSTPPQCIIVWPILRMSLP